MRYFSKTMQFCLILLFFSLSFGGAGKFSFGIYSDLKAIGGSQQRNVVHALNEMGVDFSVLPGDLVPNADFTSTIFDSLINIGTQFGPMWPVLGNHDIKRLSGTWDYSLSYEKYREAFSFVTNQPGYTSGEITYYSFHHLGCHFICLDNMGSCRFDADDAQKLWLDSLVNTDIVANAEHVFVFAHYAVHGVTGLGSRWENCITPFFENLPNFTAVFCGDRHNYVYRQHNGVGVFTVPAAGALRSDYSGTVPSEVTYDDTFKGYLRIDVDGANVEANIFDVYNDLKYHHTISSGPPASAEDSYNIAPGPGNLVASPNPFNPAVTLYFNRPGSNKAELSIYSVSGTLIKTVNLSQFRHQYTWKPENLPGGIYLVRLKTGPKILTKKVTFLQ
jgi:hypothetical protein